MSKLNVAVLFGGNSSEHEVSRMSATSVLKNLDTEKYNPYIIGITKDGKWYLFDGDFDDVFDGTWENGNITPCFISPDNSKSLMLMKDDSAYEKLPIDVVFPVLHGRNGEDGRLQGVLQYSGIPFVGCDTFASAVCMDKAATHSLLSAVNIEQTNYLWFYADRYENNPEKIRKKISARLSYPVFVKPSNAGSSVGVSKVSDESELDAAIKLAAGEDVKILVENGVVGKEIECAILGNRQEAKASIVGEIGASAEFYDYDDKYVNGTSEQIIPATIDEATSEKVREIALRAYRHLNCAGLARVDFFVTESGQILLNEINTMPGFTSISMYAKLWQAMGLTYSQILDGLIDCALENKH